MSRDVRYTVHFLVCICTQIDSEGFVFLLRVLNREGACVLQAHKLYFTPECTLFLDHKRVLADISLLWENIPLHVHDAFIAINHV